VREKGRMGKKGAHGSIRSGGSWLLNILCVSRFGGLVLEAFSVVNVTLETVQKGSLIDGKQCF
jgi:hypothetical protein